MFRRCTSFLLAPTSNVPLLLFTSQALVAQRAAALKSTPDKEWCTAKTMEEVAQELATNELVKHEQGNSTANRHDRGAHRNFKKRGFKAVLRWCAIHQAFRESTSVASKKGNDWQRSQVTQALAALDTAALQWITENATCFSCSQQMVLISFLCDVATGEVDAAMASDEGPPTIATAGATAAARRLAISRVVAVLVHRMNGSDTLESQPLPLQLTAAYALDRLWRSCNDSTSNAEEFATIQVPAALLFSILHRIRAGTDLDELCAQDEEEAAEAMLTFLLIMTPTRRAEVLRDDDLSLLRGVLECLTPYLARVLPPLTPMHIPSTAEDSSCATHACQRADASGDTALDEMAHTPSARRLRCGDVQECLTLMRNIEFAKSQQRLLCLDYYFREVRPPEVLSVDEIAALPAIFATIESIPHAVRTPLTDAIVSRCRIAEPAYQTVIGLLPYVSDPMSLATVRVRLTPSSVEAMSSEDAVQLLGIRDLHLPLELTKALLTSCLRDVQSESNAREKRVPLTLAVVALLRCLLDRSGATPHGAVQTNDGKETQQALDHDGTLSDEDPQERHDDEATSCFLSALLSVAQAVNWQDGLVVDVTQGPKPLRHSPSSAEVLETVLSVRERLTHAFSLPLSTTSTAADGEDVASQCQWPSGDGFIEHYVQPVQEAATSPHRPTLRLLVRAARADWLSVPQQRQIVEKAVAMSGVSTGSALTRFIELFVADAVRLQFHEPNITKLLLKQRSLDPHIKLFSSEFTTLEGSAYGRQYVQNLLSCCQYALLDAAQMSPQRKETVRTAASQWIFHGLLALASGCRRTPDGEAGLVEQPDATAHDHSAPAERDILSTVDDADLEALLTYAVHFGCKPASSLQHLLTRRLPQASRTYMRRHPGEDANATDSGKDVGTEDQAAAGSPRLLSLVNPADQVGLPIPPAHFIFAVRTDVSWPLPLTTPYLRAVLHDCDLSIFATVVSTFLHALKAHRDRPDLETDLVFFAEALRILVARAEAVPTGLTQYTAPMLLSDVSTVTRDLLRAIVTHLYRTRCYEAPLRALRLRASPTDGKPADHTVPGDEADVADDDGTGQEIAEDGPEDDEHRGSQTEQNGDEPFVFPVDGDAAGAAINASPDDDGPNTLDAVLVGQYDHVVTALCAAADLLAADQLKEIALSNLDRLWELFPVAAQHVFHRFTPYVADMSPRDLLLLAVRYAPAEDAVRAQLMHCDLRVHVDFGVFLRFAKSLPMSIVIMVAEAHLPTLSFAWTARLASSLSTRAEQVPTPFLSRILQRLGALAEKATDADRSLVLVILQHFIPPASSPPPPEPTIDSVASTDASPDDDRLRLSMVRQCCDKLLQLEGVRDRASLEAFLHAYPPTLRSMVQNSAVAQVRRCLLTPLLNQPLTADTLKELTALVRLLHQYDLLLPPISRHVSECVFAARSVPALASNGAAELPLRVLVELAVLVGSARRSDGVASRRARAYGTTALKAVTLDRATTPSERVNALSAIVDLRSQVAKTASRTSLWVDPDVERELCLHALGACGDLTAREFATLTQTISRLRRWSAVNETRGVPVDARLSCFHETFPVAFSRADAHNRCVVLKAISSDAELFHRHEGTAMRFVQEDVPVLSHEDLELLLSAMLLVRKEEVAEAALDAISTRLLPVIGQCRQSTLVRVMQCHAQFGIQDVALFHTVIQTLEEQCAKELRLDAAQVITLLHALVTLKLDAPEKLVVTCFQQLERASEGLSVLQQAQAAELVVALDMAYTPFIHTLVAKVLENREGLRHSARLRAAADLLCDAYDVEAPPHLRVPRLRKRREARRLSEYAVHRAAYAD